MAAIHDIGDRVTVRATLTDEDGTLTDPTEVTVTVRKPDQTLDTYTLAGGSVTRDSLGVYHKDIDVDQTGNWYYRFVGTGALVVAEEGEFYVRVRRA